MKSASIQAKNLSREDRFEMGGQTYRIIKVEINELDQVVVTSHNIMNHFSHAQVVMALPPQTYMKVYNIP